MWNFKQMEMQLNRELQSTDRTLRREGPSEVSICIRPLLQQRQTRNKIFGGYILTLSKSESLVYLTRSASSTGLE
jgi:hypothetical protein